VCWGAKQYETRRTLNAGLDPSPKTLTFTGCTPLYSRFQPRDSDSLVPSSDFLFPDTHTHTHTSRHSHSNANMRPSSILVALLGAASAAPIDHRLEDIQCRCLSLSTNAKPTLCTHMESHAFDYHTASSLASDYDLEMQFASQDTITKILSIHRPLPSGVLQRISEGQVVSKDATDLLQQQNKIVCGFGDEVKRLGSHDVSLELECHYIGYGVAAFMLLVLVYVVGEYVWMRYVEVVLLEREVVLTRLQI
jgi:hypothetical protein